MKRTVMSAIAAAAMLCRGGDCAGDECAREDDSHTVALVVQNHTAAGAKIPMMALTDALTAKLSGSGFMVINPYNSVGVNQNRSAAGEKTPDVSAMDLARELGADGAITASVIEFLETTL
ncbi:MAG: hypothetical protein ILO34_00415, partial [Kiritimatiellae bacterium]|nr:hypothetical protein [Kiritimatiellia bacterium]